MSDNLLDIACTTLAGEPMTLADYGGKALLVRTCPESVSWTSSWITV